MKYVWQKIINMTGRQYLLLTVFEIILFPGTLFLLTSGSIFFTVPEPLFLHTARLLLWFFFLFCITTTLHGVFKFSHTHAQREKVWLSVGVVLSLVLLVVLSSVIFAPLGY